MTANDAPLFLAKLNILAELFDAKFSEAKQQLYFEALSDLELSTLIRAMQEAARHCKFMPKPVELRELGVGSDDDRAESAWMEVKSAMRTHGSYRQWDSGDDSIDHALKVVFGGWRNACQSELTPEMWQARKKEFMRAYIAYEREETHRMALPPGTALPKLLA